MVRDFTEEEINLILNHYHFDNSEHNLQRLPMEEEAHLLDLVKEGRFEEIHSKGFSRVKEHAGKSTRSERKMEEYYCAAMITMVSRSAIAGGLPPDDSFDLADVMLHELEKAKTEDEYQRLFTITPYIFAKAVSQCRRRSTSYVIENVKNYISRHIFQKISVEDIAAYTGLSPNYLARLFTQSENISLHQYIQREKIQVSCNQLRYSNRPVSEIAQYMGFASQSNFGVVFRKWMKMTPTEYRNRCHEDNFSFHM